MVYWTWKKILIGAAAATLGAALLAVNSPLTLIKRVPLQMASLEKARLMYADGSDRLVSAKHLWRDKGAVIMMEAEKLSSIRPELDKLQVPLYGIVHQLTGAKDFKNYLKGDILFDEQKVFFSGNSKGSVLGLLKISTLLKYFSTRSKFKDSYKGDGTLLGGTLVIGPGNQGILYQYLSKDFGDEVDPQLVLKAAKNIRNDD